MADLWYALVALLLTAYVVLDGFDLGAGALHRVVATTDEERRAVLGAIGPYWDGNEVFLLAAGGTLFAAFSRALAVALSGLYLAVFLLLWSLVLRGISIEFRSHIEEPLWRAFWDTVFQLSSLALAVLFGAALGNLIRGFAIDADGVLDISLFDGVKVLDENGILDGYTVLVGLFVTIALASHGALFLLWKTEGEVEARARRLAKVLFGGRIVLWLLAAGCTFLARRDLLGGSHALMWVWFVLAVAMLAGSMLMHARGATRAAFILSGANIFALVAMCAAASFPELLHARTGTSYLVQSSATPDTALATGLKWWLPAVLLVAGYFTLVFRFNRGKTKV